MPSKVVPILIDGLAWQVAGGWPSQPLRLAADLMGLHHDKPRNPDLLA